MQPLDGLVDIFREPLACGVDVAFHHTGVLVPDLAAVKRSLPTGPAWEAWVPDRMGVAYTRLPGLGHYVEHVEYQGNGGAFLDFVRAPPPGDVD